MTVFRADTDPRSAGFRGALFDRAAPRTRQFAAALKIPVSQLAQPLHPFDYADDVPMVNGVRFPMALNNKLGDCTIAGLVHEIQLIRAMLKLPFTYLGDDYVREVYAELSPNNAGCTLEQVLQFMAEHGFMGEKLIGAGPVPVHSYNDMVGLLYNFGALYLAGDIPANAEAQFEAHQPWHVVRPLFLHQPIGGHCFVGSGANRAGVDTLTWGNETYFTPDWWAAYGMQGYVIITDSMVNAGHGPLENVDIDVLEEVTHELLQDAA